MLRYESDLSYRDIATACGIDEAAARKRASRALVHLQKILGPSLAEMGSRGDEWGRRGVEAMNQSNSNKAREALLDDLAPLIDGEEEILRKHEDLLGKSDELRDLRFEATEVAEQLKNAGADYEPPEDLEDRVLKLIDAETTDLSSSSETADVGEKAEDDSEHKNPVPTEEKQAGSKKPGTKGALVIPFPKAYSVCRRSRTPCRRSRTPCVAHFARWGVFPQF